MSVLGPGQSVDLNAFANYPAAQPPAGTKANFVNPPRDALPLLVVGSIATGLMFAFLACRFYTKLFITKKLTWDDLTCVIGALGEILLFVGAVIVDTAGVFGIHQWNIKVGQVITDANLKGAYVATWGLSVAPLFIKLTFFLLFWSLFGTLRWMRLTILIGGTLVTSFNLATGILSLYYQTPLHGDTFVQHAGTSQQTTGQRLGTPIGIVAVIVDVFILVLPLIAVSSLNMKRRRKLAVSATFLAGFFACVASALNTYYRVLAENSSDYTYSFQPVFLWSIVEYAVGVMCSCSPSMLHVARAVASMIQRLSSKSTKPTAFDATTKPTRRKKTTKHTDTGGSTYTEGTGMSSTANGTIWSATIDTGMSSTVGGTLWSTTGGTVNWTDHSQTTRIDETLTATRDRDRSSDPDLERTMV